MKTTLIASAIAVVMLFGCKQRETYTASSNEPAKSSPQLQSNLTPEQLGELGARIR